mmetsp:Transcript_73470/g.220796  ORF Transcript_73470/g.220796 Transcript_73470/m.220796 type:complete len:329 (-) Transcript_73470:774-1760(-)
MPPHAALVHPAPGTGWCVAASLPLGAMPYRACRACRTVSCQQPALRGEPARHWPISTAPFSITRRRWPLLDHTQHLWRFVRSRSIFGRGARLAPSAKAAAWHEEDSDGRAGQPQREEESDARPRRAGCGAQLDGERGERRDAGGDEQRGRGEVAVGATRAEEHPFEQRVGGDERRGNGGPAKESARTRGEHRVGGDHEARHRAGEREEGDGAEAAEGSSAAEQTQEEAAGGGQVAGGDVARAEHLAGNCGSLCREDQQQPHVEHDAMRGDRGGAEQPADRRRDVHPAADHRSRTKHGREARPHQPTCRRARRRRRTAGRPLPAPLLSR